MSRIHPAAGAVASMAAIGLVAAAAMSRQDAPASAGPVYLPPTAPAAASAPAAAPATPAATPNAKAAAAATPVTLKPGATPADPACVKRIAIIDAPYQRGADPAASQILICRRGYMLSFNAETRNPDWVMEHLTKTDLVGAASRSNKFQPDPLLVGGPTPADYNKSGYDRGHQAPAGDARFDQAIMDQSFYMSNMAPQVGIGFNRGEWKNLEETIRAWVVCGGHNDVVVITGPIYRGAGRTLTTGPEHVPTAFFKVVYDAGTQRAVGFMLDNKPLPLGDVAPYVVAIRDIEAQTGLDFFRSLNLRQQTELEAQPGVPWGHIATCKGNGGGD